MERYKNSKFNRILYVSHRKTRAASAVFRRSAAGTGGRKGPPRCACTVVTACRATSVNPHSVQLHCKCKVAVKQLKATPPSRFPNKRCSRRSKMLTFDENVCFTSPPRGSAPLPRISHKSAAQALHMLTFALNPLHRRRIC